jgi:lipopolysaccharide/colanic/teichoic acid biosynthesis glycosyltransferase
MTEVSGGMVLDGDGPLLHIATPVLEEVPGPTAVYQRAVKPLFDVVGGLVLAIVLLPLILTVALVVRVKLGKGIIYRQARIGRNGRTFVMYKFRSMEADRRTRQEPFEGRDRRTCHKRDDDPRHTPCGRFLRRASFDELPQLWNVIKGDMSLVGPRPELPHVVARYEPWQHQRHEVKPGLTGFWQVSDRAGGLAYESVGLDLDYIRRMSFWTDCGVLLRTVPVTLRRTGR